MCVSAKEMMQNCDLLRDYSTPFRIECMFSKKKLIAFFLLTQEKRERRELFRNVRKMERRWNYKSMNNKMTSNGE